MKVKITPNSVTFDDGIEPQIPWVEDIITEVTIIDHQGKEHIWHYPKFEEQLESD